MEQMSRGGIEPPSVAFEAKSSELIKALEFKQIP
jgi:hypothetical protein